ncbi:MULTISPECIES: lipopolysaccharide biosynthesis protein [unclassified Frankia]|uniref:lipopolysaccharide biosynthesis protein n=1 Tax=unclassified Frankia TaxID=2632575 RepID=UPI001F47842B|nr:MULTISPECIES: oligosaccharide flippase family protein [unclassified Frankia]
MGDVPRGGVLATVIRRDVVTEMLRGPMLLAAAGIVANALNLVMNLTLARIMDPSGYGAVVVQTNVYMVLAVVGTAVLSAVVHRDLVQTDGTRHERRQWIRRLRAMTFLAALVAALASLALCRPVAALLAYPHPIAIAEAASAAALWVGVCIERGLLQARRNYPGLARNVIFETVLRVTCIVAAAQTGLGVNGAGLGLLVGAVVGAAAARRTVARTPRDVPPLPPLPPADHPPAAATASPAPRRRTRDALIADTSVALATLVPLALLQNIDVVVVGWLNPDAVGGYAAISTACKVPVFLGLAVASYLLAEAARRHREGRPAHRALAMAMAVVVTPGLGLAAVGAVAGRQFMSVLFGPDLAVAAPSLWVLAVATTFLSVTLLFATYLLGAGNRKIVWVLAVCTPLAAASLVLAGGDIMKTAVALLGCQALTAAAAGALVFRRRGARPAARPVPVPGMMPAPDPSRQATRHAAATFGDDANAGLAR